MRRVHRSDEIIEQHFLSHGGGLARGPLGVGRMMTPASASARAGGRRPLRVGFVALTDAAPLAAAREQGFFARQGMRVALSREVGWATIREKIIYRELDAAQAPAAMLFAATLGLGSVPCDVLTALVLNVHGNAITLSESLWQAGVRDATTLRGEARRRSGEHQLTFGVVFPFSSHHLLLRAWLESGGLRPDRDVRIVVVPPAQMYRNLAAGTIDGYCVGEPWNTLAVREGTGWCPAWSAALAPGHLEKVLMVRADFAEKRADEHRALVAAVADACAWCDEPANRAPLARLLAQRGYVNQDFRVIAPALLGRFDCGHGRIEAVPDFHVFHRGGANVPTVERGAALQAQLVGAGLIADRAAADSILPQRLFRPDLYLRARPATVPA